MYNIEVRPKAERDTEHAIDYYFAVNVDLAIRFNNELYKTYEKIIANPQFYKYLSSKGEIRYTRLKSFPYIVIFRVRRNKVVVISVFNTHRKPIYK